MKIIFFDGNFPMCHSWIRRIIRRDKQKVFRFSSLEGELAKKVLTPFIPDYIKEDTIIFYDGQSVFMRSSAALQIIRYLGFPYNLLRIGLIVPKSWRDAIYAWIAGRRYTYGKRYDVCPMPPVEWRDRFI
jgi:predicted DCC family thiol-disulfide oxidoreductase YuxK